MKCLFIIGNGFDRAHNLPTQYIDYREFLKNSPENNRFCMQMENTYGNRVYLTRNGHGQCAIIDMKELDELDKQKALYTLMSKLNEAEVSIREEGTISADDLEAELGV